MFRRPLSLFLKPLCLLWNLFCVHMRACLCLPLFDVNTQCSVPVKCFSLFFFYFRGPILWIPTMSGRARRNNSEIGIQPLFLHNVYRVGRHGPLDRQNDWSSTMHCTDMAWHTCSVAGQGSYLFRLSASAMEWQENLQTSHSELQWYDIQICHICVQSTNKSATSFDDKICPQSHHS